MARYVLFCRASDECHDDIARIAETSGVEVLDETLGKALLIEARDDAVTALKNRFENWLIEKEKVHPPPGIPRHSVEPKD